MQSRFVDGLLTGRRSALKTLAGLAGTAALGAGATAFAPAAEAATRSRRGPKPLDYQDPHDNLYAFAKMWAGFDKPVIGAYHGVMYARVPGKRLLPLFNYVGTGILQAKFMPDGKLALKSRETGYFSDLRTGEILETWHNPLTDRTVEVYHFYNDVVGGRMGTEIPQFVMSTDPDAHTRMNEGTVFPDADGRYPFRLPFQFFGDDALLSWDYAHHYRNPVTPEGWPTYSSGPTVSPSEHFLFRVSRRELEDRDVPSARVTTGFSRLSEPWPFMRMGGTPYADVAVFGRMHSHKGLAGHGDVPRQVLDYVEKHAPEYLTLPDDWPISNARLDTWSTFASDVPPETPGYAWKRNEAAAKIRPPTGLGARAGAAAPPT
jgi:hypothetical protein